MGTTTTPRVTIGLPVRNGERHLRSAIESILGQTWTDLELVVSDNASTDATAEICAAYASDPRVRYERQPVDIGARENFHLVLSRARGEYFKWAACDDVLAPTFLERCVEALEADPGAVLAAADIEVIGDGGEPLGRWRRPITVGGDRPHERLRAFFEHDRVHQTIFGLIRRSALEQTGLLGPWYGSDRALLMELVLLGRFVRVPERLFRHREHVDRSAHVASRVAWFTPQRGERPVAGYWRHLGEAARMLLTVPMPPAERLRCLGEYGRRGRAQLREWAPIMGREATASLRTLVARLAR